MKTYLINLDRNPERLAFIKAQLDALGLAFTRIPACDGRALTPDELARHFSRVRSFIAMKKKMSAPEIGCAISHTKAYRQMLADKAPAALILEDGIVLSPGFVQTLQRVENFMSSTQPQVFVLSGYGLKDGEHEPETIRREPSIWCADAYCLNRLAAELILAHNDPVITVADHFKRWRKYFGLELYRVLPTTVKQDDTRFQSENLCLPKSNCFIRMLMRMTDRILIYLFKC